MESASLLRRFFAFLFDWLIVNIMLAVMVLAGVMAISIRSRYAPVESAGGLPFRFISQLWLFLFFLYHTFFTYFGGQTPAKMLFKIKIISNENRSPGFRQALVRSFGYLLSSFFFLGFVMALFTVEKKGLHDLFGRTRVVEDEKNTGADCMEIRNYL